MIRITIEAPKGTGKSTLGAYLAEGLMGRDIAVVLHDEGIARRLRNPGAGIRGSLRKMARASACVEIVELQTNPTEGSHEESPES